MLRTLQLCSGFAFYVLGGSFLVAYVLLRNALFGDLPAVWMQTADMPLAFAAIVYGGTSFALSLRPRTGTRSTILAFIIGVPLAAFFGLLAYFNYWVR